MSYALSKGKFPKNPKGVTISKLCEEDFKNLKERNGTILFEHLSALIKDFEKRGINPDIYKKEKQDLEVIRELVMKGAEKLAFTQFARTFPYCLPHRSRLYILLNIFSISLAIVNRFLSFFKFKS